MNVTAEVARAKIRIRQQIDASAQAALDRIDERWPGSEPYEPLETYEQEISRHFIAIGNALGVAIASMVDAITLTATAASGAIADLAQRLYGPDDDCGCGADHRDFRAPSTTGPRVLPAGLDAYPCCRCCYEGADPDLHADGRRDFHEISCSRCDAPPAPTLVPDATYADPYRTIETNR